MLFAVAPVLALTLGGFRELNRHGLEAADHTVVDVGFLCTADVGRAVANGRPSRGTVARACGGSGWTGRDRYRLLGRFSGVATVPTHAG
jgi:hypothetical protein